MKLGPVDHITLNVKDMEKAVAFYKKLGMIEEGSLDNRDIVFLWNGDKAHPLHIQLDTCHKDMKPGLNHIALTMPKLEDAAKEVKAAGIKAQHEPFYQKRSGRTIFTFSSPDNVDLQFAREDGHGEYLDAK
jgi:catechol 2,3-dioxygenase-like lactoylglutathione lyase family enzyme